MKNVQNLVHAHQVLERAIRKKLRSIDQEDEVLFWEQGVRQQALAALFSLGVQQPKAARLVAKLGQMEQPTPMNVTDWLHDAVQCLRSARSLDSHMPKALLCMMMAKPRMTAQALAFAQQVKVDALQGDARCLFLLIKSELMVNTGQLQLAHADIEMLDPEQIQDKVLAAIAYDRIARLLWARNSGKALDKAQQGLKVLLGLMSEGSDTRLLRARVQIDRTLAQFGYVLNRMTQAQVCVNHSVTHAHQWAKLDANDMGARIALARSLRLKGDILAASSRSFSSFRAYRESRKIIQGLLERLPHDESLQAEVPRSHDALGDLHFGRLELSQAYQEYQSSVALNAHLRARDPDNVRWRMDEVNSALKMASVLKRQCDYEAALGVLEIAWKDVESLLTLDPASLGFQTLAIEVCEFAGSLELGLHNHHKARAWLDKAQMYLTRCLQADTLRSRWEMMQISLWLRMSTNDASLGDGALVASHLMAAKNQIVTMLGQGQVSARVLSYLATLYMRLSVHMLDKGDVQGALGMMASAHETAQQCCKMLTGSTQWQIMLANIQMQLAQGLFLNGQSEQSKALKAQASRSLQALSQGHIQDLELYRQWLLSWLQTIDLSPMAATGDTGDEVLQVLELVRQHRAQAHASDGLIADLWVVALGAVAEVHLQRGQWTQARRFVEQRLVFVRGLMQAHPSVYFIEMQHVNVLAQAARLNLLQAQPQAAIECASEGLMAIERHSQGEYSLPAEAVPLGQLLLSMAHAYAQLGLHAKVAQIVPRALQLARWMASTGTQHPAHLALIAQIQPLQAMVSPVPAAVK